MKQLSFKDRAAGALMGAWIGDALGVGPHWYYDLNEMRKDYGDWIDGYTTPKQGRYHDGLKAGELSQAGFILEMTVRSLVESGGYDQNDFCDRMDKDLFPLLNGEPANGPGGYTSQSIREAWRRRVEQKLPWTETGGHADTTEAIERTLAIAIRYALSPGELASTISRNTVLTQADDVVVSMTVAYGAVLAMLVQGHALDTDISSKLMTLVKRGELPFHAVTREGLKPPRPGDPDPPREGRFSSPDALLSPGYMAAAAKDQDIRIEPASKVSMVYGMPCAIYHMLPAAYYLAARFSDDFESAVLHSLNGGGQNLARTMLTGALAGAQVGLSGIPERFIEGLDRSQELLDLAGSLAGQAAKER
ncbi:ADP-ribosylglycohydrolase family protein [Pseudodesulfovibrio sp. zrk46]|uniref:ADP-ribosylglycohydrolase family protein n=1 Tax=Pseudodesulfovibrio sp. zrk46 TaxID=2725288 RepID=UPI001449B554|nr:ADP-ribosylglycohydrolase family protein [Pseudodesulfovibrio sp. zrk46]QJB56646.1 ADP-ribosylglycohydrolase family protein [Pseudodesulfovibrio sp. zrk46]